MERSRGTFRLKLALFLGLIGAIIWASLRIIERDSIVSWADWDIRTDGNLTKEEIRKESGIAESAEFAKADLGDLKQKLEALPQIRQVTISDTGRLEIETFKPVARMRSEADQTKLYLLDAGGYLKAASPEKEAELPFPSIVAKERILPPGNITDSPSLFTALNLCVEWKNSDEPITEVHELNDFSVEARFESGTSAIFGVRDLSRQINDLNLIFQRSKSSNRKIATVNLLMKRNIPITFRPDKSTSPNPDIAEESTFRKKIP